MGEITNLNHNGSQRSNNLRYNLNQVTPSISIGQFKMDNLIFIGGGVA